MRTEFQLAHTDDAARDVAETMAEYNLLALPVVDDAMEYLLPKGWRQRLPRLFG